MSTDIILAREAWRALRALAKPLAMASQSATGGYEITQRRAGHAIRLGTLEKEMLTLFLSRDWVRPQATAQGEPPRFVVTSSGRAALLRQASSSEPYLNQHRVMRSRTIGLEGDTEIIVNVNLAESPLAWLRSRRMGQPQISDTEFEAGERLRQDFTMAQMAPRVTADWTRTSIDAAARNGVEALSDSALRARMRVSKALAACGPGLADVLYAICCELKGIGPFEQETGWPQRSAKVVLKIALNRLARHYGLIAAAEPKGQGPIRAWAAE